MAEVITRGGVVWRWVRMACSVFKDGQVQLRWKGGRSQRLETASFLCSSPAGWSPFSKPLYPAPTVSCPLPQGMDCGEVGESSQIWGSALAGAGRGLLHAERVRVVSILVS